MDQFHKNRARKASGTLLVISRWLVAVLRHDKWENDSRVTGFTVHCPDNDPMAFFNVHLPHQTRDADKLLYQVRQHLGATGLRGGIVGDFNATPTEQHVTATRMEYCILDTEDDTQMPTSHPADGNDGKHIDYMMASRGIQFSKRLQEPTLADHDLVAYDLEVKSMEPTYVWK